MWDELLAAFGLMLVLEGIMPFVNPANFRRTLARMAQLEDRLLRLIGSSSMAFGLIILYFFR